MNIEKTMRNIPHQSEYILIDKVKAEIMNDPIYSKCPICGRKVLIKMDWSSWYNGMGAFAQIKCSRRFFPHVKSIECGKATMSRALEHAFKEWKKAYNKKVKVEVVK